MCMLGISIYDQKALHKAPCLRARTTLLAGPPIKRKPQMIKYKGTNLYLLAMNDVLNDFKNIENHIIEISTDDLGINEIIKKTAVKDPSHAFLHDIKDRKTQNPYTFSTS